MDEGLTRRAGMDRRRFLRLVGGAVAGGAAALSVPFAFDPFRGRGGLLDPAEALASGASAFPLDPAAASRLLAAALGRGASFADLYLERRFVTRISVTDSKIDSVEQGVAQGCGIRAVTGERTGYAFGDTFEEAPLLAAARDAAAIASAGGGRAPGPFRREEAPATVRPGRSLEEAAPSERVSWLEAADRAARDYDPSVQQVTLTYSDELLRFAVVNSEGLWIEDTLPLVFLQANVVAVHDGRRGVGVARAGRRLGAEQLAPARAAEAGREAARMAVAMRDAQSAPGGEMPVVLAAGGGVLFHEAVGHGLEGDFARKGTSFYTKLVGQRVASERVSVWDTGALPELRGSYNVDDEGTVPRETLLIERGVLRGFLTDRMTAEAMNIPRTGSGRRQSYRFPPLVRMSNTYLSPGTDDPAEMVAGVERGLYAAALGGGEVDTTTGNFTFGVREGYLIERGRIGAAVSGAVLVGSGPEVMQRIDRVGPDLAYWIGTCGKGQWVPVTCGAPTLRIASMTVGGEDRG